MHDVALLNAVAKPQLAPSKSLAREDGRRVAFVDAEMQSALRAAVAFGNSDSSIIRIIDFALTST
jgi:hypothetical protein